MAGLLYLALDGTGKRKGLIEGRLGLKEGKLRLHERRTGLLEANFWLGSDNRGKSIEEGAHGCHLHPRTGGRHPPYQPLAGVPQSALFVN